MTLTTQELLNQDLLVNDILTNSTKDTIILPLLPKNTEIVILERDGTRRKVHNWTVRWNNIDTRMHVYGSWYHKLGELDWSCKLHDKLHAPCVTHHIVLSGEINFRKQKHDGVREQKCFLGLPSDTVMYTKSKAMYKVIGRKLEKDRDEFGNILIKGVLFIQPICKKAEKEVKKNTSWIDVGNGIYAVPPNLVGETERYSINPRWIFLPKATANVGVSDYLTREQVNVIDMGHFEGAYQKYPKIPEKKLTKRVNIKKMSFFELMEYRDQNGKRN